MSDLLLDEVRGLVEVLCDDELSADQELRLQDLLQQSESAQWLYLDYLNLHANLNWDILNCNSLFDRGPSDQSQEGSSQAAPLPQSAAATARPAVLRLLSMSVSSLRRPVVWSVAAFAALFAGYVAIITWGIRDRTPHVANSELRNSKSEIEVVATITAASDVQWSGRPEAGLPPANNRGERPIVQSEPLQIDSGLVELKLRQGATLSVEGPASWSIDGDNLATLKRGKLVAKVPQQAIGFTLKTPAASIVDLGTEFGVTVDDDGRTASHVFRGRVRISGVPLGTGRTPSGSIIVGEGQSVEIATAGDSPAAPRTTDVTVREQFNRQRVTPTEPGEIAVPGAIARHKPAIYLPMECDKLTRFLDAVSGRPLGLFDSRRSRAQFLVPGRRGNALRFVGKESSDCLWIDPTQDASACDFSQGEQPGLPFTIALWFKEIEFSNGQRTLCCKGPDNELQYLLDTYLGQIRFLVSDHRSKWTTLLSPDRTGKLGEWQHVAAVFDPVEQRSLVLYFNGQEVGRQPLAGDSLHATRQPLQIGNRGEGRNLNYAIDAAIDEFAVFSRALTVTEVQTLWKSYGE